MFALVSPFGSWDGVAFAMFHGEELDMKSAVNGYQIAALCELAPRSKVLESTVPFNQNLPTLLSPGRSTSTHISLTVYSFGSLLSLYQLSICFLQTSLR